LLSSLSVPSDPASIRKDQKPRSFFVRRLTFGTIASLFGLSHGIIDKSQYSTLAAAIIGTAIIPTIIANTFFLPRHLLPHPEPELAPARREEVRAERRRGETL
jgi:hypothetical protein